MHHKPEEIKCEQTLQWKISFFSIQNNEKRLNAKISGLIFFDPVKMLTLQKRYNLTIGEQRPFWKTQFVAVFCLTGVQSFCFPARKNKKGS